MATFERRGRRWRVQVYRGGVRKSGTFATKAEAAAWAMGQEARLGDGVAGAWTVGDAMARYAVEVSPTKRGARWEVLRLAALGRDAELAGVQLADCQADTLSAWRDRRLMEVTGPTVGREMTLLKSVFGVARREWRWLSHDPLADVRKPARKRARRRRITDDEIERMRFALGYPVDDAPVTASQRVAVAWLVAIETGMRAGELLSLEWAQVHLVDRYVHLDLTKNGDERDVALSSRAVALIGLLPKDAATAFNLHTGTRDSLFRRAREAARIDDLHFHDARAEAVWRLSKKLDILQLARMIGHRDIKSLTFYFSEHATETARLLD